MIQFMAGYEKGALMSPGIVCIWEFGDADVEGAALGNAIPRRSPSPGQSQGRRMMTTYSTREGRPAQMGSSRALQTQAADAKANSWWVFRLNASTNSRLAG